MTAVLLINPKYPHNVGGALRACSAWGVPRLAWTAERVPGPGSWPKGARLPREERLRLYRNVEMITLDRPIIPEWAGTPVAVELRRNAEDIVWFEHPQDATYVFGPEDGSLDAGILSACHRFLVIPSRSCLNLAAAVNVVLYDRYLKAQRAWGEVNVPAEQSEVRQWNHTPCNASIGG